MTARRAALAAFLAVVVTALPAGAAKKVCRLLTDAAGDGRSTAVRELTSPALDIHSADVATGRQTMVVVLRLASVRLDAGPATVEGARWSVGVKSNGVAYQFLFDRHRLAGDTFTVQREQNAVTATARVDEAAATVTWVVDRAALRTLKAGAVLTFNAATSSLHGTKAVGADAANSPTARYVDRTPSCVSAR